VAGSPVVVRAEIITQQGYVLREKMQARADPSQGGEANGLEVLPAQVRACVYLKSTENKPDDDCWWCDPENDSGTHQTRNHLFKHCYKWKDQQAAMRARVKEVTKKGKQKWRVGDLLADEMCSPAVLDSCEAPTSAPPVGENWDSEDEAEKAEVAEVEEQAE